MAISNTSILIKRSLTTGRPSTLNQGEFAYSYASNTLFIGTPGGNGVVNVGGQYYTSTIDAATSANTASAIVARDSSGNFSAGTITATLSGNASTATALATARTINGTSFDGTANITVTPSNTYTSNIATLSKNAIFKGVNDSGQYTFYALEDSYADRVDNKFIFNNVELVEGKQASQSFVITSTNLSDAFPLSNKNVDTTTLSVYVQKSATEVVFDKYVQVDNILDVKNDSLVYFIEENGNGTHELRFGDNVLGKQLIPGNIVYVTYHVSSGVVANGSTNIAINGSITGTGETITLSYSGKASGGADAQSIDSIRNTAPKFNATKNRAVTADDYGALIKSRYSNINSITIWGGEDNDPPIYGKVFISIEPLTGSFVTTQDKHDIVNDILKPRGVVGIQPVFVDPEYTYLSLDVVAKYDTKKSTLTPAQVKNSINDQINSYFINDLATKNKKNFYYSELNLTRCSLSLEEKRYKLLSQAHCVSYICH